MKPNDDVSSKRHVQAMRELIDFIDANGTVDLKIVSVAVPDAVSQGDDNPVATPRRASRARPVQRRKRGSKVVETILEALKDGEADIPALKSWSEQGWPAVRELAIDGSRDSAEGWAGQAQRRRRVHTPWRMPRENVPSP